MIEEIRSETETLFERLEKTFGVRLGGTFVALTRKSDGGFERAGTFTIVRGDGDAPAQVVAPTPSPHSPTFNARSSMLPMEPHPDGFPGTDEGSHYMAQTDVRRLMPDGAATRPIDDFRAVESMQYTGDVCTNCGSGKMRRSGTCATCQDCGTTSGCG